MTDTSNGEQNGEKIQLKNVNKLLLLGLTTAGVIKAVDNTLFADVKNKHNKMNSSSAESLLQKLAHYANSHKTENISSRRHINDIDPTKIAGFFDDDGYKINTDLIEKRSICIICVK